MVQNQSTHEGNNSVQLKAQHLSPFDNIFLIELFSYLNVNNGSFIAYRITDSITNFNGINVILTLIILHSNPFKSVFNRLFRTLGTGHYYAVYTIL